MDEKIDYFVSTYNQINKDTLHLLDSIYSKDIIFKDPMHQVNGIDELKSYFENLYENVSEISFDIYKSFCIEDNGFLYWTMTYRHSSLNNGKAITVDGHSNIIFQNNLVVQHKDYFDVGSMLYRQIPILRSVIGFIDRRTSQ